MLKLKKFKIIIVILILILNMKYTLSNEIVLQKNNVIITETDLDNYKKLHFDYFNNQINNHTAKKKLYMTLKIIDNQIKKNPNFIKQTNKLIINDVLKYEKKYSEYIISYFLRYEILKKDYINYYINQNNLKELSNLLVEKIIFYNDDKCQIKIKSYLFKDLTINHKKIIINNLSKNIILVDKDTYACLTNVNKDEINSLINGIILEKGNKDFLKYVHKTIK
jgi:hypothetical protein